MALKKIARSIVIPIAENKYIFERVKASRFDDRKWHCIELILCHLRSSNPDSFDAAQICIYFLRLV